MKDGDLIHHTFPYGKPERDRQIHGLCNQALNNCYAVVKKERFEEQWPEDPEFKAFAAEVADAVQVAIWRGWKIAPSSSRTEDSCCPLGARTARSWVPGQISGEERYPAVSKTADAECSDFICGFDIGVGSTPYHRLGQAYRKRFVKEKGE